MFFSSDKKYSKKFFFSDIQAGLTVGIMAIPQAMAYGMLAGLPAIFGLYACLVPAVLYAWRGQSNELVVGPTAMEAILTAVALGALVPSGNLNELIPLVALFTLSIGGVQFLMGTLKLGFLVRLISSPVLAGFTAGVALIIVMNQLKLVFGISIEGANTIIEWFPNFWQGLPSFHSLTLVISIVAMVILWMGKKYLKRIPMALIVVIFSILGTWIFDLEASGLRVLGPLDKGFPSLTLPVFDTVENWPLFFQYVMAIALISVVTTTANIQVLQSKTKAKPKDINIDIQALGLSNIGGALFNAFPVSASFSRSFINYEAGAKTKVSGLIQVVITLCTLLFLTRLFYYLPICILGVIIIMATYSLIDISKISYFKRISKHEVAMYLITFAATILLGINYGILTGISLSMLLVIIRSYRPHIAVLAQLKGTPYFKNIYRYKDAEMDPSLLIIRFDHPLYYLNAPYFQSFILQKLKEFPKVQHLVIHAGTMSSIDSTGVEAIEQILDEMDERHVKVYFSNCVGPVRDVLYSTGILERLGTKHCFMEVSDACDYIRTHKEPNIFASQTNRKV